VAEIQIAFLEEEIASFCRRNRIQRLAFFGSVLGERFGPDSDVDVLVDFEPDARVGFMSLSRMQRELVELLGRPVDLVPREGLKPVIRDAVLSGAKEIYCTA
jgi:uncharacterized protein